MNTERGDREKKETCYTVTVAFLIKITYSYLLYLVSNIKPILLIVFSAVFP